MPPVIVSAPAAAANVPRCPANMPLTVYRRYNCLRLSGWICAAADLPDIARSADGRAHRECIGTIENKLVIVEDVAGAKRAVSAASPTCNVPYQM